MSHVYKVGYGTPEESHYWEFSHDDVLDRAAFMLAVKRCLLAVLQTEEIKRAVNRHVSLEIVDLFETAAFVNAMEAAGFRPVKYEQRVNLDGWARLDVERDPHEDDDAETREVLDFLRAGGDE